MKLLLEISRPEMPHKRQGHLGCPLQSVNSNFQLSVSYICNCSACFYHIQDLQRIHCCLDLNSAKLLANALLSRRLEYCNSLLSGIADTHVAKLQRVQNRLARVVTMSPPFTRTVPLLRSLHWLPVKFRVDFKICFADRQNSVIYTPCLLLHFHHVHWDQIKESLCLYLESRPMLRKGHLALVPLLFGTACHYQSVHPLQFPPSGNVQRHIFFDPGLSPIDTGVPDDLLTLWNCFIDFAVEHWVGCCTTEPGYARDIGAVEIWLID